MKRITVSGATMQKYEKIAALLVIVIAVALIAVTHYIIHLGESG